jgi:hypothetical protein
MLLIILLIFQSNQTEYRIIDWEKLEFNEEILELDYAATLDGTSLSIKGRTVKNLENIFVSFNN